jgi:hypothetical protein
VTFLFNQNNNTPSVPEKASQLSLNTEKYRHALAIDTSLSTKNLEAFFFWNGGSNNFL